MRTRTAPSKLNHLLAALGALALALALAFLPAPAQAALWNISSFWGGGSGGDASETGAAETDASAPETSNPIADDLVASAIVSTGDASEGSDIVSAIKSVIDQGLESSGDVASLGVTEEEFEAATEAIYSDPYYSSFVTGFNYSQRTGSDGGKVVSSFSPKYSVGLDELPAYRTQLQAAIDEALSGWYSADASDFENYVSLHDYVVRTTTRCTEDVQNTAGGALGALVDHYATTRGYNRAYAVLLAAADLPYEGFRDADSGAYLVLLPYDGAWYIASPGNDEVKGADDADHVCHTYFLVGTDTISYVGTYAGLTGVSTEDAPVYSSWPVANATEGRTADSLVSWTVSLDENGQVPDRAEALHQLFQQAVEQGVTEIPDIRQLHITQDEFHAAAQLAGDNDPYLACMVQNFSCSYMRADGKENILYSATVTYNSNVSDPVVHRAVVDAAIAEALSGVYDGMSDYDKALYVHDWLVSNVVYNESMATDQSDPRYASDHTAYGALVDRVGVCDSYARAYQLLCQRVGLNCVFVESPDEMSHSWNMVQVDGQWYHVDVTWDDPIPDQGTGYVNHTYFLLSDEQISADHWGWTSPYAAPSSFWG